jgi:hypothetical protein
MSLLGKFGLFCVLLAAIFLLVLAGAGEVSQSAGQTATPSGISLPTDVRVQSPGWWPTKGEASREVPRCEGRIPANKRYGAGRNPNH